MFDWLYKLLGSMLEFFSNISGGSYALALLFYALVFKIIFLPFSIKQQKNQIAMAKLAPKIEVIKAKYKGRVDRVSQQKMQQEIMELQQKEGFSPFSGCLPMLIQLPLIIFLYNVIRKPLSYITKLSDDVIGSVYKLINGAEAAAANKIDHIDLISKINKYAQEYGTEGLSNIGLDVTKIPDFTLFGYNLADPPAFTTILCLIPFIAAALQWFTMWITRKFNGNSMGAPAGDDQARMSMRIMDITFPLMTLFFAFSFSGMLGVYWIYQSVLAIIQTILLAKLMPVPKYTQEEIKAMQKAAKEQEKLQKSALKERPKFRSLHYIDEDDYDELPELKKNQNNKNSSPDRPVIKD